MIFIDVLFDLANLFYFLFIVQHQLNNLRHSPSLKEWLNTDVLFANQYLSFLLNFHHLRYTLHDLILKIFLQANNLAQKPYAISIICKLLSNSRWWSILLIQSKDDRTKGV